MERVTGYAPASQPWQGRILLLNYIRKNLAPMIGIAPMSSGFSDRRSTWPSYLGKLAFRAGIPPATCCLEGNCSDN